MYLDTDLLDIVYEKLKDANKLLIEVDTELLRIFRNTPSIINSRNTRINVENCEELSDEAKKIKDEFEAKVQGLSSNSLFTTLGNISFQGDFLKTDGYEENVFSELENTNYVDLSVFSSVYGEGSDLISLKMLLTDEYIDTLKTDNYYKSVLRYAVNSNDEILALYVFDYIVTCDDLENARVEKENAEQMSSRYGRTPRSIEQAEEKWKWEHELKECKKNVKVLEEQIRSKEANIRMWMYKPEFMEHSSDEIEHNPHDYSIETLAKKQGVNLKSSEIYELCHPSGVLYSEEVLAYYADELGGENIYGSMLNWMGQTETPPVNVMYFMDLEYETLCKVCNVSDLFSIDYRADDCKDAALIKSAINQYYNPNVITDGEVEFSDQMSSERLFGDIILTRFGGTLEYLGWKHFSTIERNVYDSIFENEGYEEAHKFLEADSKFLFKREGQEIAQTRIKRIFLQNDDSVDRLIELFFQGNIDGIRQYFINLTGFFGNEGKYISEYAAEDFQRMMMDMYIIVKFDNPKIDIHNVDEVVDKLIEYGIMSEESREEIKKYVVERKEIYIFDIYYLSGIYDDKDYEFMKGIYESDEFDQFKRTIGKYEEALAPDFYSAGVSVGNNFPTILLGFLFSGAGEVTLFGKSLKVSEIVADSSIFLSSSGEAYREARERGYSYGKSIMYELLQGGINTFGEIYIGRLPYVSKFEKASTIIKGGNLLSVFLRSGINFISDIGVEIIEEEIELPSSLLVDFVFGENVDWKKEWLYQIDDTAISTLIATGVQNGGVVTLNLGVSTITFTTEDFLMITNSTDPKTTVLLLLEAIGKPKNALIILENGIKNGEIDEKMAAYVVSRMSSDKARVDGLKFIQNDYVKVAIINTLQTDGAKIQALKYIDDENLRNIVIESLSPKNQKKYKSEIQLEFMKEVQKIIEDIDKIIISKDSSTGKQIPFYKIYNYYPAGSILNISDVAILYLKLKKEMPNIQLNDIIFTLNSPDIELTLDTIDSYYRALLKENEIFMKDDPTLDAMEVDKKIVEKYLSDINPTLKEMAKAYQQMRNDNIYISPRNAYELFFKYFVKKISNLDENYNSSINIIQNSSLNKLFKNIVNEYLNDLNRKSLDEFIQHLWIRYKSQLPASVNFLDFDKYIRKLLNDEQTKMKSILEDKFNNNYNYYLLSKLSPKDFFKTILDSNLRQGIDQLIFKNMINNSNYQKYVEMISNHYGLTKKVTAEIMKIVDSIGACSYGSLLTCLVLSMFRYNPSLFEKQFGFPLYIVDDYGTSRLNSAFLLFDLYYFANDKKNGGKLFENGQIIDHDAEHQIYMTRGNSINMSFLNAYFKSKGIKEDIIQIVKYFDIKYDKYDKQSLKDNLLSIMNTYPSDKYIVLFTFFPTKDNDSITITNANYPKTTHTVRKQQQHGHIVSVIGFENDSLYFNSYGEEWFVNCDELLNKEKNGGEIFIYQYIDKKNKKN